MGSSSDGAQGTGRASAALTARAQRWGSGQRTHRHQAVQGLVARVKLRAQTQCRGLKGGLRQGRLKGNVIGME